MRLLVLFGVALLMIGDGFAQIITLTAPTPRQERFFGRDVAVLGNNLYITEQNNDDPDLTDVHVYRYSEGTFEAVHRFSYEKPLPPGQALVYRDHITVVDTPGGTLLLAAVPHKAVGLVTGTFVIGEITVFRNHGSEESPLFQEVARLYLPELGNRHATFGASMAVAAHGDSSELVVGVPTIATLDYREITSKVVRYRTVDGSNWNRIQDIDADALGNNPGFGASLALAQNRLFVSARVAAAPARTGIFRYEPDPQQPDQWVQTRLFGPDFFNQNTSVDFKYPIHVMDNGIMVTADPANRYDDVTGRVYVFDGFGSFGAIQSLFNFTESRSGFAWTMGVLPGNRLLIADIPIPDNDTLRPSTQEFRLIDGRLARVGDVRSRYGVEPDHAAYSFTHHVFGSTPYLIENHPIREVDGLYGAGRVRLLPLVPVETIQGKSRQTRMRHGLGGSK